MENNLKIVSNNIECEYCGELKEKHLMINAPKDLCLDENIFVCDNKCLKGFEEFLNTP